MDYSVSNDNAMQNMSSKLKGFDNNDFSVNDIAGLLSGDLK